MQPMLATRADRVPAGPDWTHEVKWDGHPGLFAVENLGPDMDGLGQFRQLRLSACAEEVLSGADRPDAGAVGATHPRDAVYDAKCAALDAGMSVAEVDAQTWVVEIHPSEDRTSQ